MRARSGGGAVIWAVIAIITREIAVSGLREYLGSQGRHRPRHASSQNGKPRRSWWRSAIPPRRAAAFASAIGTLALRSRPGRGLGVAVADHGSAILAWVERLELFPRWRCPHMSRSSDPAPLFRLGARAHRPRRRGLSARRTCPSRRAAGRARRARRRLCGRRSTIARHPPVCAQPGDGGSRLAR